MVKKDITVKQVEAHLGEKYTAKELRHLFGYSQTTYIADTTLAQRGWLKADRTGHPFIYEIVKGKPF